MNVEGTKRAVVAIILLSLAGVCRAQTNGALVELLKHPYPYKASVTVCSDTHATDPAYFEAVHEVVNTTNRIEGNPRLAKVARAPLGGDYPAQGFGLPIADSFWIFDDVIGVFPGRGASKRQGAPLKPHPGREERVLRWLNMGWVDSLHTFGEGPLTRHDAVVALDWLDGHLEDPLRVWVNHRMSVTPLAPSPDSVNALSLVTKNTLKGALGIIWPQLLRRVAEATEPAPIPKSQRLQITGLAILAGVCLAIGAVLSWLRRGRASRRTALVPVLVALVGVATLAATPVRYAQGDNRDSSHYCADLLAAYGIRFYWLVTDAPDYTSHARDGLALPERLWNGRSTYLRPVRFDDGSLALAFPRACKGPAGQRSLELLSKENLDELCERGGSSILYTHWTLPGSPIFRVDGARALANLADYYHRQLVWVAPTSQLLRYHYVSAFLDYQHVVEEGVNQLRLGRVNDPLGVMSLPTLRDLRHVSFRIANRLPVKIEVGGVPLPPDAMQIIAEDGAQIVVIR